MNPAGARHFAGSRMGCESGSGNERVKYCCRRGPDCSVKPDGAAGDCHTQIHSEED